MKTNLKRTLSVLAASAGAIAIATVGASSTIAAAPDVFSVTSLTTDNVVYTDAATLAGDDDGFLGVTGTKFLFSGDTATVAYDLADFGNPYVTDIDNGEEQNNWLFSDLKTQTSYLYVAEQIGDDLVYDITGIQPLDGTGDISGSVITLSETITIDNEEDDCTIFASGYGRSAIWDGCLGVVYDIELPSGVVTTVDAATFADYDDTMPLLLDWYEVDNGVSQSAIVEYDGSALHVLAVARTEADYPLGIFRYDVQSVASTPSLLISFGEDLETNYVDLYKFTASPATNQWCAGVENGWDAITEDPINELAFCASATFAIGAAPAPEPALANTGLDLTSTLVAGGVVLLGGAGLLLLARRRSATN